MHAAAAQNLTLSLDTSILHRDGAGLLMFGRLVGRTALRAASSAVGAASVAGLVASAGARSQAAAAAEDGSLPRVFDSHEVASTKFLRLVQLEYEDEVSLMLSNLVVLRSSTSVLLSNWARKLST